MKLSWSRLRRLVSMRRPPHRNDGLTPRRIGKIGVALGAALAISPLAACARQGAAVPNSKDIRPATPSHKSARSKQRLTMTEDAPASDSKNYRISHWSLSGMASWYGAAFANRLTSSGERFDPEKLTAAHRRLPLGTKVMVVDARTRKSVVVTITDRGPFNSRVIDLSRAAARRLGMLNRGLAHVRIAVLAPAERQDTSGVVEVAQAPE